MKALAVAAALILSVLALGYQPATTRPAAPDAAAITYEHLANAIIEIRATEENLVRGILMHYEAAARRHMEMAAEARGNERVQHLEAAAAQITNIASEGDKSVQAVRQRLLKAGHHHHTDAETEEDYIFVDSREKKSLLALANRVSRMGASASADDIHAAAEEMSAQFTAATAAK
jgi:hypothetical protein